VNAGERIALRAQQCPWPVVCGMVCVLGAAALRAEQLPDQVLDGVPDVGQAAHAFAFPDPIVLCAPVAVANSMSWLQGRMSTEFQVALVNKLSSRGYMTTRPLRGTQLPSVLAGVRRYVTETWGGYHELAYAGWGETQDDYASADIATLPWLVAGLGPGRAVWLNVGWYRGDGDKVLRRVGGHWLTLVGYKEERLLVHDPGPWAGSEPVTQGVMLRDLGTAVLVGDFPGLPASAAGRLELVDLPRPDASYVVVLDGAVRLQL